MKYIEIIWITRKWLVQPSQKHMSKNVYIFPIVRAQQYIWNHHPKIYLEVGGWNPETAAQCCTKGRRRSKDHTYSLGMSRNKTTFPVMSDCFDKIRWLDTIHPRELRVTRWYLLPVKHQMKPTEIATIIYCTKIQKKILET